MMIGDCGLKKRSTNYHEQPGKTTERARDYPKEIANCQLQLSIRLGEHRADPEQ